MQLLFIITGEIIDDELYFSRDINKYKKEINTTFQRRINYSVI